MFATMRETGRVEFLFDPQHPLLSDNCAFVIASVTLNFHAEITWPGQVDIGTRITGTGRSSMTLAQALFQHGRCVATANTVIVQMNESTRQSQPLSATSLAYLATLMSAVPMATRE